MVVLCIKITAAAGVCQSNIQAASGELRRGGTRRGRRVSRLSLKRGVSGESCSLTQNQALLLQMKLDLVDEMNSFDLSGLRVAAISGLEARGGTRSVAKNKLAFSSKVSSSGGSIGGW